MGITRKWEIGDRSQVGEARRAALTLCHNLGLPEAEAGKVGLVVTELGTNLVKHTPKGGTILANILEEAGVSGLELLALDQGPGIRNINEALRDGYSTAGSPGTGLGAIRRLASSFDVYSTPETGTALLVRLWFGPQSKRPVDGKLEVGAIRLPHPAEAICGDSWAHAHDQGRDLLLVCDGLGHGLYANEASKEAVRAFHKNLRLSPADMITALHAALRGTRGATAAIAEIDPVKQALRFAGVGNIGGAVLTTSRSHGLISHSGTLGQEFRRVQAFDYPWSDDTILIMHTDGLSQRWQSDRYPGLERKAPVLIAGVLFRDLYRGRDDAAVVVARSVRAA